VTQVRAGTGRATFGEWSMVDRTPRTATLKTEEPTLMLFIDPDLFERIIKVLTQHRCSIFCDTTASTEVLFICLFCDVF
jgi:hypothetical protein